MTKLPTRVHVVFLFIVAVLALLAEPVSAQSRGRSRGGDRNSPFRILFETDNRDELNLSDEQIDRLETLQEELQSAEEEGDRPDFRNFPQDPEERAKFFAEFRKQQEARNSAAMKKIQEVLQEDQYRRLEQLRFQGLGIQALGMDAVAADLKLSDQQQDELSKLLEDYQSARRNFRAPREEREKATEKLESQILAVLSDDQKAAWQAKLGPPADEENGQREQPAQNTAERDSSRPPAREATYSEPDGDGPVVVSLEGSEGKADSEKSAKPAAKGRSETVQFHLENAPWEMVLKRFADKAGLTLQMIDVPPGSLTYTNDRNWYSPTEALDILHGYLLQKGFVMIKRDRFLVVLDIDKGPIPPNLIPNISIDELENGDHGKHELLNVVLPLQGADADDAAREVESLKGPQGSVVPLSVSNSLVVTDTYSNLKRIHNLLKGVTNVDPEELQFKSFPLDHVLAEEAAIIVRGQLGLDLNPSSSSDRSRFRFSFGRGRDSRSRGGSSSDDEEPPDARVNPDARTNRLLVTGTPNQLAIAEQVLTTIDIEADPQTDGRPYLHVYHLKLADTDEVRDTLDVLFPGLVVGEDEDRQGGRLHVKANARQHQQIAEEIAKMDGSSSQSSAVLPVNSHDPLGLASTLNNMFVSEDYPPTIMADSAGRRLLVRGSNEQVTEIRKFLSDLGENGSGAGSQNGDRGPLRRKSLGGRDAEEFARILEQVWRRQSARPVNVVIPSNNPIRDRVVPSLDDQTQSPFLENLLNPSTSRPPKSSETDGQKSTSRERDPLYPVSLDDEESATEPAEAEPPAAAKKQESPEPKMPSFVTLRMTQNGEMLLNGKSVTPIGLSKFAGEWLQAVPEDERKFVLSTHPETSTADSFRVLGIVQRSGIDPTLKTSELDPSEPEDNAKSPENANNRQSAAPRREQPAAAANSESGTLPITMTVRGGELMLYDPTGKSESLDEMESLIEQLALAIPPRTTWTVYYLRSAEATETATMLEQLFPASSVGTGNIAEDTSFMGQLSGGVASLGSGLMDASGLDSITQDSSILRIIPEVRSNSLFVSGPVDQVNQVEQMLRVLDADELPETLRERVPRMIPVEYASVNEVATIVKDVYKDFLEQEGGRDRGRRNPLEAMMGGGRSRDNGRGNGNGGPSNVRMTIGVDTQTSNLVVSANDSLFQQVKEMVEELDEAARQARRTVQIVNVNESDTAVLQQALTSLLPSVSVSSTGSDSSSSRSDSSSSSRGFGSFGNSSSRSRFFDRSRSGSRDSSSSSSRSGSDNNGRSRFGGNSGGESSDRSRFRGFNRGGSSRGSTNRGGSSSRGGRRGR